MKANGKMAKVTVRNSESTKNVQNPIPTDTEILIEGLNHDLAREFQALMMYIHYSAKITGPYPVSYTHLTLPTILRV